MFKPPTDKTLLRMLELVIEPSRIRLANIPPDSTFIYYTAMPTGPQPDFAHMISCFAHTCFGQTALQTSVFTGEMTEFQGLP